MGARGPRRTARVMGAGALEVPLMARGRQHRRPTPPRPKPRAEKRPPPRPAPPELDPSLPPKIPYPPPEAHKRPPRPRGHLTGAPALIDRFKAGLELLG